MKNLKAVMLDRTDLRETSKNKHISKLDYSDFTISFHLFLNTELIMFCDDNERLKTRIIKNRYGHQGMVKNEF